MTMDIAKGMGNNVKTSYQRDIEIGKLKNEGELFGGTILRMGKETCVETHTVARLYSDIAQRLVAKR